MAQQAKRGAEKEKRSLLEHSAVGFLGEEKKKSLSTTSQSGPVQFYLI
jgi:hypothetical protein